MPDARDGYAAVLDLLWPLYPDLLTTPGTRLAVTHDQTGHLANGWYLRCHRGVQAILALERNGYSEEAAPIRRSIIEHLLALKWLAVEGNAVVDPLAGGHAYDVKKRIDAVSAVGWESVDLDDMQEIINEIEGRPRDASMDGQLQFTERAKTYGDGHEMPGYLAELGKTHPCYESAVAYCDISSGTLRLIDGPRVTVQQTPFATTHLLDALLAVRHAFDPRPWRDELREALAQFMGGNGRRPRTRRSLSHRPEPIPRRRLSQWPPDDPRCADPPSRRSKSHAEGRILFGYEVSETEASRRSESLRRRMDGPRWGR